MSVQVENLEKNMAKLTIEVSAEEFEKAIQSDVPCIKKLFDLILGFSLKSRVKLVGLE